MFGKKPTARYEAEVDLQTKDGRRVTYRGDGIGPADKPGAELLDGAEAAALAAEPGARILRSRARKA